MQRDNSTDDCTEQQLPDWQPFNECPDCGCEYIRVFVITENIVRGDGGGGIVEQEWVREYDLLKARCRDCNTKLYEENKTQ